MFSQIANYSKIVIYKMAYCHRFKVLSEWFFAGQKQTIYYMYKSS
jgi:hypothetical protein